MEAVKDIKESMDELRAMDSRFEPEILAFCCEH